MENQPDINTNVTNPIRNLLEFAFQQLDFEGPKKRIMAFIDDISSKLDSSKDDHLKIAQDILDFESGPDQQYLPFVALKLIKKSVIDFTIQDCTDEEKLKDKKRWKIAFSILSDDQKEFVSSMIDYIGR